MSESSEGRTSPTLLGRLRCDPTDQAAWKEFVARYAPVVFRWCRRWGLQEADAEDVTQNVLLGLGRQMRSFAYDPAGRFRSWLCAVARAAWGTFLESRRQAAGSGDSAVRDRLDEVPAGDDLVRQIDAEAERELLDLALARVRLRVEAPTWEAFRLTALEGVSGVAAGERLGLSVASVYQARSRIQKLLREEVARLEEGKP
jgi:RNA polymerase sigma factor (sigma-70 family)